MTEGEGGGGPLVCLIDRGDVPLPELEAELLRRHVRVMRAQGDAYRAVRALSPDVVLLREEDANALLGSLEREASAVGATVVVIGRADWVEPRSSPFRAGGVVTLPSSAPAEALALRIANEASEARERNAARPRAHKDDAGIDEFAAMATTRDLRAADRARADVLAMATAREARSPGKRPPAGLFSGAAADGPTKKLPMPEVKVPQVAAPPPVPASRPAREEPTREIQLRSAEVRAAFDATADELSLPAAAPASPPGGLGLPPPAHDDDVSLTSRDVGKLAEARALAEPPTAPLLAVPPATEPATIPRTAAPVIARQDATVGLGPPATAAAGAVPAPRGGLALIAGGVLVVVVVLGAGGAWLALGGATPAPVAVSLAPLPTSAPVPSAPVSVVPTTVAPSPLPAGAATVATEAPAPSVTAEGAPADPSASATAEGAAPPAEAVPTPSDAPTAPADSTGSPSELLARASAAPDDEAEPLYREVLAADPREFHAALGLAQILMRRGAPEEAIPFIEVAVRARRRRAAYHVMLGDAYQAAGDTEHAQAAWREALEVDPNDHDAQQRLE